MYEAKLPTRSSDTCSANSQTPPRSSKPNSVLRSSQPTTRTGIDWVRGLSAASGQCARAIASVEEWTRSERSFSLPGMGALGLLRLREGRSNGRYAEMIHLSPANDL